MKFVKVNIEHINLALQDFKVKGLPVGFKQSAYFDVEIEGELYPPKPIMAYANYHATGEEPTNNFSGGVDTPCFKAFERLGIPIIKKTESMSSNAELYKLREDFLKQWPIDRLKAMTIEEYTNLDKTSFCYSLEHVTSNLGSIRGGSSYKFGIYRMGDSSGTQPANNRTNDGEYAWHTKYGVTREQAYASVKSIILKIATLSLNENFSEIEEIDLGDAFKWKIAFLYSNYKLINIFKHSALKISAEYLGYSDSNISYTELNKYILSKKGDQDFFDFAKSLWKVFDNRDEKRKLFENWLNLNQSTDSGKVSSYLRAIDILENEFEISVYNEDEVSELEDLYEDLKNHQKDEYGKYFFNKAKSYGKGGFYSAAVGMFIEFVRDNPAKSLEEQALINLLRLLGKDISIKYYILLSEVINKLGINLGDNKVHYTFRENKKRFGLTFGQKYGVMIEIKKRQLSFGHFDTINPSDNWWIEVNSIQDLLDAKSIIIDSAIEEYSKTSKSGYKKHSSKVLERSILYPNYRDELFTKAFNTKTNQSNMNTQDSIDLNQIFFGPPGTGKTFHTINEAIKIVDPEFYEIHKNDREQLKARFKLLSLNNDKESVGQIGFTTFHQSFSYEDFIEGIKPSIENNPKEDEKFLKYKIEDGVFKWICGLAEDSLNAVAVDTESLISLSTEEYEKAHFYKMSLGNTQDENDNEIYEYCIENNCISIGFGDQLDFTGKDEKELRSFGNDNDLDSFSIQAMNLFSNYLKIGNYVVISYGNKYVRAVGKVTGDYEYRDDSELPNNLHYKHFRSVEWIFTDEKISANEIYNKNLSQQTIYKLDKKYIKQEFFVKEKKIDTHRLPKNPKNFVLIVDEINRGNVSSVFGELITLIEKDKRSGADEELSVTLPYSKKTFSVPHNVYIIGTMNTADRSIEALDTALRRRFSFREMPPKPELIKTVGSLKSTNGKLGDIDVVKILKTINNRIEKLIDKDHKIGHSYFLNISSKQDLIDTFRDKVIPLLEEYFFGDFGKISLVLGSSFISKESADGVTFATSNDYDPSIANDLLERSVYEITNESNWDFKAIYE